MCKWSTEETTQYMIDAGFMPWEKEAITDEFNALQKDGAAFDFDVRLLRYDMECKMTGKDRKRVENRAKMLARAVASGYYDAGWRERDCIERATEVGYTPMEAFEIGHLIHMYEWEQDAMISPKMISKYAYDIFHTHWTDWTEDDLTKLMIEEGLTTNQTNRIREILVKL